MRKLRLLFIGIVGLLIFSVLLASSIRNIYGSKDGGKARLGFMAKPLKFMAEIPSYIKQVVAAPEFYVLNSNAVDGLDHKTDLSDSKYPKLLVTYKEEPFNQKFDLIDLNDGSLIKQWAPDNEELYEKAYNNLNPRRPARGSDLYLMHPLLLKDSSLLFTSQLTSLMARIDSKSDVVWLKNDKTYHHTMELDADGNAFVCSRPFISDTFDYLPQNPEDYQKTLLDDHITKIDPNTGKELFDKSVLTILIENGYKDLIVSKGQTNSDPIHLNDIQPALSTTEYWEKGDLLVSCRNLSAIFLYRPRTNKILWLKSGPWYNQHDADFIDEDKILVFGNDVLREESIIDPRLTSENLYFPKERKTNNAYIYHLKNDSISTPYTGLFTSENIHTYTSGRCDILNNGDIFIEETNQGRVIIGDSINMKMEYVKRLNEEYISSMFWSRIIN